MLFGRIAREARRGGEGASGEDSKEVPRTRRLAIKISEYETLNVEPYTKKKKKKGKGKMNSSSSSRSPTPSSRTNSKRSAVFDYGNIYQGKDDSTEDYFLNSSCSSVNSSSVNDSSVCSSNQTISSYGSNPSLTSGQTFNPPGSQPLKQHEARFHSPIRTREQQQLSSPAGANPLDIKMRSKRDKVTPSFSDETRDNC
jgi:hypothetical protein